MKKLKTLAVLAGAAGIAGAGGPLVECAGAGSGSNTHPAAGRRHGGKRGHLRRCARCPRRCQCYQHCAAANGRNDTGADTADTAGFPTPIRCLGHSGHAGTLTNNV